MVRSSIAIGTDQPVVAIDSMGGNAMTGSPIPVPIFTSTLLQTPSTSSARQSYRLFERKENRLINHTPQGKLPPQSIIAIIDFPLPCPGMSSIMRRGARVAESGSLENCCPGNGTVGSIPTLSANFQEVVQLSLRHADPLSPQVSREV